MSDSTVEDVMASHIACPHRGATNHVATGKPSIKAQCGACHRPPFDGHPAAVDAAQFEKHRRENNIAVLVDMWAPWCGPCRATAPMFERAARELGPEVRLVKLKVDEEPKAASELGITGIPALLLFRGARVVARTAGAMDAPRLVAWVRSNLARAA